MRKSLIRSTLTVFAFLFFALNIQAQIEQGTWSLGNSFSFFHNSLPNGEFRSTSFGLDLAPGFFIIDNLRIGANIGLALSSSSGVSIPNNRSTSFNIGGQVTYMIQANERLYIPVFSGIDFSTVSSNDTNVNFNNSIIQVGAGLEFLINSKLGARYSISFNRFNNSTVNQFRGNLGVFFYL